MILRSRQKQFVERSLAALKQHQNTLGIAPTGCHALGTPILMFDGTLKRVENIQVGDILMGPGSSPRRVCELHRGQDTLVQIRPLKGDPFTVNLGHILTLVRTNTANAKREQNRAGQLIDISVSDWLASSNTFRHLHKLLRMPADFPDRKEPALDPYMLGVLIGDGHLCHQISVTTPDIEIVDALQQFATKNTLRLRCEQTVGSEANAYFFADDRVSGNRLVSRLKTLGLFGRLSADKFIPEDYKLGSRSTRLSILAGLLDTDGHLMNKPCFEFSSRSLRLAKDVVFIARSLGFLATLREKEVNGQIYLRANLSGDLNLIPTKVLRKQAPPRKQKKNVLRCGFTVHPIGVGEYFGFTVDGDHRYLMGDFTLTHNSGKTIMLSGVAGALLENTDAKACVLAHRDELTTQNAAKFTRVNPSVSTSIFDAQQKSWDGQATFAMVQTLGRETNLKQMPALDLLVIDEAHHAAAPTYRRIIDRVQERNPEAAIFGVTATPNRGDKKGLRPIFSNVADQITLSELIQSGHLVPPRTFVIDVGAQEELSQVKRVADDFDMAAVGAIMDKAPITDAVIQHWKEKAGDRPTVVFCSTVDHVGSVTAAFRDAGVGTELIHGKLTPSERQGALRWFTSGQSQVAVNVAVLVEGFDFPPTSCVVLLRPSSYKSTLIQMIGRGLRTVDPNEHPGIVKQDCIVLDFGTSTLLHGSLEQDVNLKGHESAAEARQKTCPECGALVPVATKECSLCDYVWEKAEAESTSKVALTDFVMSEIDLLKRSFFRWCDLFSDDAALMATGFEAWAGVFFLTGHWFGLGGGKQLPARLLAVGERTLCLAAADDWLNEHESEDAAIKSRKWLNQTATAQQLKFLPLEYRQNFGLTRYHASCLLAFQFNKSTIQSHIFKASEHREAA